jgi:hypothetical protein
MSFCKQIVCLANSRKLSERCIAGLEIERGNVGGWIRPVSKRQSKAISCSDQKFEDGSEPQLLDILKIHMLEQRPHACQTENHLIDDQYYWTKMGEFPKHQLLQFCGAPNPLWVNGFHSYNGINDRIPEEQANSLPTSLVLVEPQCLILVVGTGITKPQVRAEFCLAGQNYNLVVTDPIFEQHFIASGEGRYSYKSPAVACISIGEPFCGYRYKLIASIIDI